MPVPVTSVVLPRVDAAMEQELTSQQLQRILSKKTQALTELLAHLKPARLSSELLLRLLQPFHAKINPENAQAQDLFSRISPETQRFLLRMSLSLTGSEASKLLAESTAKIPFGKLMEMIGEKNAIALNNNAAAVLAKATAAAPGSAGLGKLMDIGQILNARVLEQHPNGQLRLLLANQVIRANLPNLPPLSPGDSLSLQLTSLSNTPQLKVLSFASQNAPENLLLRQLLPRQGNLQQLFQQLTGAGASAPDSLKPLSQILNSQILNTERLGTEIIRSMMLSSGIFLEANLARKQSETTDLKSALLRMVAQLRAGPEPQQNSTLLTQLYNRFMQQGESSRNSALPDRQQMLLTQLRTAAEGALAKVEVRQLTTLQQSDDNRQSWQLSLPMLDQQKVKDLDIRIQREKQRKEAQGGDTWTVNLHFDFDSSGPLDVRIDLKQEDIGVVFWAEWQETLQRVGKLMPKLEHALEKAGLTVTQMSAFPGQVPETVEARPDDGGSLLSVTA